MIERTRVRNSHAFDCVTQIFRYRFTAVHLFFLPDREEFLPADAADLYILRAAVFAKHVANAPEERIPFRMAVAVVELLVVVDIQHHAGHAALIDDTIAQYRIVTVKEHAPVHESCQLIRRGGMVQRKVCLLQIALGNDVLQRKF
ncbi:hypothetical protein SDC9_134589 [bioreactor metagenome]|uniref:Uncharacterized protein n=1 Tax=bioreactor metagenome TaxID=1076179 RepID=A0A645DF78_9ZZZZ